MIVICVLAGWSRGAESVAEEATSADSSLTPRRAMIRSAMVPGWGQYSNGHPLKATLFSASAVTFLAAAWSKIGDLGDTSDRIELAERELQAAIAEGRSDIGLREALLALESEHEDDAARRNTYFLGLFATMTFSALDAYIDAHLVDFGETPTRFEMRPRADGIYGQLSWVFD